jgi:hypothetical protein
MLALLGYLLASVGAVMIVAGRLLSDPKAVWLVVIGFALGSIGILILNIQGEWPF